MPVDQTPPTPAHLRQLLKDGADEVLHHPGRATAIAKTVLSQLDDGFRPKEKPLQRVVEILRRQSSRVATNPTDDELAILESAVKSLERKPAKARTAAKPQYQLTADDVRRLVEQRRFHADQMRLLQPGALPSVLGTDEASLKVIEAAVTELLIPKPDLAALQRVIDVMPPGSEMTGQFPSAAARRAWTSVRGYLTIATNSAELSKDDSSILSPAQRGFDALTQLRSEMEPISQPKTKSRASKGLV